MTALKDGIPTVDQIRKRYPDPRPGSTYGADGDVNSGYCVGGAFCFYVGRPMQDEPKGFPTIGELAAVLEEVNPALVGKGEYWATWITQKNDTGDMDGAWAMLGAALSAGRGVACCAHCGSSTDLPIRPCPKCTIPACPTCRDSHDLHCEWTPLPV